MSVPIKLAMISLCLAAGSLSACQKTAQYPDPLPPLKHTLDCMPEQGSIMAAHRGVSRDWQLAENSLSALEKLITDDYLIAEIDVAGLKDGTLITFHDGVWEEASTGRGPVAATRQDDLDSILLKTRRGKLTADRPALFEDMLRAAKGRIYLEVDFKSSARFNQVIDMIRDEDMEDHVLLIAYTGKQAKALRKIAPDMLLSAPQNSARSGNLVWLGKDVKDDARAASIKNKNQYVIGRVGRALDENGFTQTRRSADILVTDYANQYLPVTGLGGDALAAFEACLSEAPD